MENREIRKRAINIEDSPDEKENEMLTVDKVLNDPVIKDWGTYSKVKSRMECFKVSS